MYHAHCAAAMQRYRDRQAHYNIIVKLNNISEVNIKYVIISRRDSAVLVTSKHGVLVKPLSHGPSGLSL